MIGRGKTIVSPVTWLIGEVMLALNGCLERGLRLPDDISFVGYGDPSYYRWISGGISTIRIPVDNLAAKTANLLGKKWSGEAEKLNQYMLPAELVIRQSSRPSV